MAWTGTPLPLSLAALLVLCTAKSFYICDYQNEGSTFNVLKEFILDFEML
jgi:hypothetical protein